MNAPAPNTSPVGRSLLLRQVVATVLLLGVAAWEVLVGLDALTPRAKLLSFGFAAVCALAGLGVALRSWWARWLAQGIGASVLATLLTRTVEGQIPYHIPLWLVPLALLALLAGHAMREHYEAQLAPSRWQRAPGAQAESLRWAIILGVGTVGALGAYAVGLSWDHYGYPTPRMLAVVVGALLLLAVVLLLKQRTLGLVVWVVGVVGLGVIVVYATQTFVHVYRVGPPTGLCGQAVLFYESSRADLATIVANLAPGLIAIGAATTLHLGAMVRFMKRPR